MTQRYPERMRAAAFALWLTTAAVLWPASVQPLSVPQGGVFRITTSSSAASARLGERTVRLFAQADRTMFGLMPVGAKHQPGSYKLDVLATNGQILESTPVTVTDANFPEQNIAIGQGTISLQPSPGEMETMRALRRTVSERRHWLEPFVNPVSGCMTSPFGVARLHNGKPTGNFHAGLDQRAAAGHPVKAATGGVVRVARMFNIHGGTVGIDHGQGVITSYLHLSRLAAVQGASVQAGEIIGYAGTTGRSTAPHLHWELNISGVAVNPLQWAPVKPCPVPRSGKARGKRRSARRR